MEGIIETKSYGIISSAIPSFPRRGDAKNVWHEDESKSFRFHLRGCEWLEEKKLAHKTIKTYSHLLIPTDFIPFNWIQL